MSTCRPQAVYQSIATRQYTQMQYQYTQAVVALGAYDMQRKLTTNDSTVLHEMLLLLLLLDWS